ncbi:outer membrane protein assembly factor BamB family protein [Rosistilla ulvae]|uniref:outer membrane protein assembly factor BamB family protein n=1 Tax=Rosistilla ulvae TaxID=1930277 RepID=UPI001C54D7CE|nr:PQQ-binding-like beta-propeller repeat protein [Rosistilla ulvae]
MSQVRADDWTTYRHDQRRSGVTSEALQVDRLSMVWQWQSPLPPASAWPDAARWDAYSKVEGLRSMRDYDSAFQPVIAAGKLLVGSNADDSLRCFDLSTGEMQWIVTVGGPIRVAPTIVDGLACFGSDDGSVYAVEIETGTIAWKRRLVDTEYFVNDGRLCSFQPVRTGVLYDAAASTLLAGSGLFPWQPSHLFSLKLETGEIVSHQKLGKGWTIEGPMLLGEKHIISPQGRAQPRLFTRADGAPAGELGGGGGTFALLTEQGEVLHGPGNKAGWLTASHAESREKFASFENGISMVVDRETAFLLDPTGVTALDRVRNRPIWKVALRAGEELILAGSTVLVGSDGYVAALSATDGHLLWASAIAGRGRGLAVANGHLVVSTDRGEISVFRDVESEPTGDLDSWIALSGYDQLPISNEPPAATNAAAPQPWPAEYDLLERWTLQNTNLQQETDSPTTIPSLLPGGHDFELPAGSRFIELGEQHALVLEQTIDAQVVKDFREIQPPRDALTATATVRIDTGQPWGGLISIAQDNGSYERGWILGYRDDKFGFAVSAEGGEDKLSWAINSKPFHPGQWYHLVGTYDGNKTCLYVNGELVAEHKNQSGPIAYPEKAAFQLASYRDDDEHYYSQGRLHELAMGKRALDADQVKQLYKLECDQLDDIFQQQFQLPKTQQHQAPIQGEDAFQLDGLQIEFIAPRTAAVQWTTDSDAACRVKILAGSAVAELDAPNAADATPAKHRHRCLIHDVDQREVVRFCIEQQQGAEWLQSANYQCDGHFDYTRPQLRELEIGETYTETLDFLATLPWANPRGIAAVVQDDTDLQTAEALCIGGGLDVVVFVTAPSLIEPLREKWIARQFYGRPISVRLLSDLSQVPNDCINIAWVAGSEENGATTQGDDWRSESFSDLQRVVTPQGFIVGDRRFTKGQPNTGASAPAAIASNDDARGLTAYHKPRAEGAAGWTHMYGLANNTAFAGETLSGASQVEQLEVTWAGRPGPRYQSDRGNRKPSPLAAGGRLYLQGHHRLITLDSHNGTILWAKELSKMVRFNVPRDCSNWCCDAQSIYVATEDVCLKLDGATGKTLAEFTAEQGKARKFDWGFVARHDDLLVGSSVAPNTSFTGYWGGEYWYDAKEGEHAKKVASDILFAIDSETGKRRWRYDDALVVNPTISISAGRIIFTECRSQTLRQQSSRRLDGPELWENLFVVALDLHTGEKLWESPAKPLPGVSAMYGVSTEDQYLLQTSNAGEFAMYSLDLETGGMQWRGKYGWEADHHGKHLSRPAVLGDKIFLRPLTLDRTSGKVLAKEFPAGHQCGTYTCSSNSLFLRAGNLAMWDGESSAATRWDRLRPDCWISTIPAEGMLLSPEGGGGCSCGGWIETSVGFGPRMTP